ncbi:MAG: tRNA pseudouridine(13) synthase TruD [Gammaproteobacteria bacterium]|nr:tRNA pseudouridine(13) synthase TruD [Gammaproteobacteria bacterium]
MTLPEWARAHGAPLFAACIRQTPADFVVREQLGFEFSGDGEHDFLHVEKTGANTEWVARQLARHADVPARDIGYSGLKDRHAVTRQWFSVPRWNSPDWQQLAIDGVRLVDHQRHNRKLRRGAHAANEFRIVLRGDVPCGAELEERLSTIAAAGVPNYFGEQRFGHDGSNIALADAWAAGRRLPRHKRSIAISTARSYLFNRFLDMRVREGSWNCLCPGDRANLDGSGSVFEVDEVDDVLRRRCKEMDIHPAGWLPGIGAATLDLFADHENWLAALAQAKVRAANRSLRLRVSEFSWAAGHDALTLEFVLRRGAFATSVIREIAETRGHLS